MSEISRPTPTIEDYLGVIYTLTRDGEAVIGRKLAEWLEVSAPTVSVTLQRMVRDGWVVVDEDKVIRLTPQGNEAAVSVLTRHMLTELLLAKVLGVPWSQVHAEADRLEHAFSSETAERLAHVVSDPSICPHGNPIPGREAVTRDLIPLMDAEPGRPYLLARVHEEIERSTDLMAFLEGRCLLPGAEICVTLLQPYNETITVRTATGQVVLGINVARRLWVAPVAQQD